MRANCSSFNFPRQGGADGDASPSFSSHDSACRRDSFSLGRSRGRGVFRNNAGVRRSRHASFPSDASRGRQHPLGGRSHGAFEHGFGRHSRLHHDDDEGAGPQGAGLAFHGPASGALLHARHGARLSLRQLRTSFPDATLRSTGVVGGGRSLHAAAHNPAIVACFPHARPTASRRGASTRKRHGAALSHRSFAAPARRRRERPVDRLRSHRHRLRRTEAFGRQCSDARDRNLQIRDRSRGLSACGSAELLAHGSVASRLRCLHASLTTQRGTRHAAASEN